MFPPSPSPSPSPSTNVLYETLVVATHSVQFSFYVFCLVSLLDCIYLILGMSTADRWQAECQL